MNKAEHDAVNSSENAAVNEAAHKTASDAVHDLKNDSMHDSVNDAVNDNVSHNDTANDTAMQPAASQPSPASFVTPDPWQQLQRYTPARIALGRAGSSLPTQAQLDFQLAHAQARDAVHSRLEPNSLRAALETQGHQVLHLHSAAPDRQHYLMRPDWGRRLSVEALQTLEHYPEKGFDLALVIADGLSAKAVQDHALALIQALKPKLSEWRLAPIIIVEQARVAIGDAIGAALQAQHVAVLIGERPGLSSADSLGIYLTYAPRPGRNDAERNCISNVRPAGLAMADAAEQLYRLLRAARHYRCTGVALSKHNPHKVLENPQALPENL